MRVGQCLLGLAAIGAGAGHLAFQKLGASIVPDYLPAHRELVVLSGVSAIAGGVAVLLPPTRRPAAWGLVAWLIAVYPANVWMAQHPERYRPIPEWMLLARLPFQIPMIWWTWRYTRPERQFEDL